MRKKKVTLCVNCVERIGEVYNFRPITAHTAGKCQECSRRGLVEVVELLGPRREGAKWQ